MFRNEPVRYSTTVTAEVTNDDDVVSLDESTIRSDFRTNKRIYSKGTENILEKPSKSFKVNFLAVLGWNTKSILLEINNLNEFEFGKALFKIKIELTNDSYAKKQLNYILSHYDLSKKEITEILEEYEDPFCDFDEKIERSLKNNQKDNAATKARKLGKHCKRVSTENSEKRKNVKIMHIYKLLNYFNFDKILKNTNRTVIHLDNAKAHKTDLIYAIADKLNIVFVPNPVYSPRLNPTEKVWDIQEKYIRTKSIDSKEDLIKESHNIFDEKCTSKSLTKNFKKKYLPDIN